MKLADAAAAKELNELRERWLNPPEWTVEKILEFPGSIAGPWARYIDPSIIKSEPSTLNSLPGQSGATTGQPSTGLIR
jgi:hypothetical protein